MRIAALLMCVLPLLACRTVAPAQPPGSRPPSEGKTSLQLIAEARERGELDEDTATLYRVYSVVDGSKLPVQYRGTLPMKDGTSVIRDARSRFDALRPETQEALRPYLFPQEPR